MALDHKLNLTTIPELNVQLEERDYQNIWHAWSVLIYLHYPCSFQSVTETAMPSTIYNSKETVMLYWTLEPVDVRKSFCIKSIIPKQMGHWTSLRTSANFTTINLQINHNTRTLTKSRTNTYMLKRLTCLFMLKNKLAYPRRGDDLPIPQKLNHVFFFLY